jgi:hypothetical protein
MEPEVLGQHIPLEPGAQSQTLALFDLPTGMAPPKTLTVFWGSAKPLTYNISGLTLPDPVAPVTFPVSGAVGGTNAFVKMGDYDVRFDGIKKGGNSKLYAFITCKNPSKDRWMGHPGLGLDVAIIDKTASPSKTRATFIVHRALTRGRAASSTASNSYRKVRRQYATPSNCPRV